MINNLSLRELTERLLNNELQIQENEHHFQILYETLKLICNSNPDLIWAKDVNGVFTHVNKSMCENLLCTSDFDEPIGKNDMFFVNRARELHPNDPLWHTFGEVCVDSDAIILKTKKSGTFIEDGNVKGKYLCLEVNKSPIFLNNTLIGTVGSGRNITDNQRKGA